jgi:ABC-type nickel/cobalt efflux system permease component RcnA
MCRLIAGLILGMAVVGAVVLATEPAFAQAVTPFGVGRPDATMTGPPSGFGAWILARQSEFYRALSASIRASKQNGTAPWGLMALSLAYGVFHAAGPGHGKAVISAYLFASGDTLKKGVVLAFLSALVQAIAAILLVAVLAAILGATASAMDSVTLTLERLSYGLIAAVGAWLAWRKGSTLWHLVRGSRRGHDHVHGPDCGHLHAPLPAEGARMNLRSALGTVMAIGVRPCTGAIIVLVFALAQGVFLSGIAATFAMALGTAVTVAGIATLAVTAKSVAVRFAAPGNPAAAGALGVVELVIALALLGLGLTLMLGVTVPSGQA